MQDIHLDFLERSNAKELISAILYNKNINTLISVNRKEMQIFLKSFYHVHRSKLFVAKLKDQKVNFLIREIQFHPVTEEIIHIDFFAIEKNQDFIMHSKVNVLNKEKCRGVKEDNGIIFLPNKTVQTIGNLDNYVENIDCDISQMRKGEVLMCNDLNLKVKFVKNVSLVSILDA